jgi:MOSC domain-containing protein YiiM
MKLVAVNVGRPREVEARGRRVRTAIFKSPVEGRRRVGRLNVEGDDQADRTVHGGAEKAVYAYPAEHYPWWRTELGDPTLSWGAFGENLTTEGLLEQDVGIGDRYRVGTAELVVTQPRTPCYKLGIRFGNPEMVKRFARSGRSGFYLAVEREGEIEAGDDIVQIAEGSPRLTVAEVVALYSTDAANQPVLARASEHAALPALWRDYFRKRLFEPDA